MFQNKETKILNIVESVQTGPKGKRGMACPQQARGHGTCGTDYGVCRERSVAAAVKYHGFTGEWNVYRFCVVCFDGIMCASTCFVMCLLSRCLHRHTSANSARSYIICDVCRTVNFVMGYTVAYEVCFPICGGKLSCTIPHTGCVTGTGFTERDCLWFFGTALFRTGMFRALWFYGTFFVCYGANGVLQGSVHVS